MFGWTGQIARVDLGTGTVSVERLDSDLARAFLGSRGLATKLLYDEMAPGVDPLGPDNKLIFATGPLTGTMAPSSGRYTVVTRSPLTGAIACSNAGGFFGPELKYAGFDMLVVEGCSREPVYLWVEDGAVQIRPAGGLWGKGCGEADRHLRTETDSGARVACIGPAGEALSLISCVVSEGHRAAGRSGVGAVMGSKKLKAVAVRGRGSVRVADMKGFVGSARESIRKLKDSAVTGESLPKHGTAVLVNTIDSHGIFPTRNFQTGRFDRAEDLSGERLAETFLVRTRACLGCPIACSRVSLVAEGKYRSLIDGPEYESLWALGADCGVGDLEAVIKANALCNEYGLDTISMGATVACAMEMYEKGYLSREEAGFELGFGSGDALVESIRLTAERQGIGDLMAEGSCRMAERFGCPELSMSTKMQEYPAYDPRGAKGLGITYATANRGGCHVRGYTISPEILGLPEEIDPFETRGKETWAKDSQDATAAVDSSGMCLLATFGIGLAEIASMLKTATGTDFSEDSLKLAGERVWNLERQFNLREGFGRRDDTLASRLLQEPMPEGPAKGHVVELDGMLQAYYQARGWDAEGRPTPEKLAQLGLKL